MAIMTEVQLTEVTGCLKINKQTKFVRGETFRQLHVLG